MSRIPSSRGSAAGIKVPVQKFDNTHGSMTIGSPGNAAAGWGVGDYSTTAAVNVSEFDEVVLNINCIDNFGNASAWGGLFASNPIVLAQILDIQVIYSNMVDFVELPPTFASPGSKHWSPLLLEEVVTPFVGSVDVAKYSILIKDIQTGAFDPLGNGTAGPPPGAGTPSQTPVERQINLRIPTTMAEWIAFIISVDVTASNGGTATLSCQPIVEFSLYRGVAL
jgi:hypothetical protein